MAFSSSYENQYMRQVEKVNDTDEESNNDRSTLLGNFTQEDLADGDPVGFFDEDEDLIELESQVHEMLLHRRRKRILMVGGALILLTLIIGVSIGVSTKNDGGALANADANYGGDEPGTVVDEGTPVLIPYPDSDLGIKCEIGGEVCDKSCAKAACCTDSRYVEGKNCYADNPDACDAYIGFCTKKEESPEPETPANDNNSIDEENSELIVLTEEAPWNLSVMCSQDRTLESADVDSCQSFCRYAACCQETAEPFCFKENEAICNGYSACWNPERETPNLPDLDSEELISLANKVKEVCAEERLMSQIDRTSCVDDCEISKCCFVEGDDNCSLDRSEWCGAYMPCLELENVQVSFPIENNISDDVEYSPEDLANFCSTSSISSAAGRAFCNEICTARQCCWRTNYMNEAGNCQIDKPDYCNGYTVCEIFDNIENQPDIELEITKVGSFGVTIVDSSSAETGQADLTPVERFCRTEALSTEAGREKCQSICNQRACCFTPIEEEGSCALSQAVECARWVACQLLYDFLEFEATEIAPVDEGPVDEGSAENSLTVAVAFQQQTQTVDDACSRSNIRTQAGERQCKTICEERSCCFPRIGGYDCYKEFPDWCDEYSICKVLKRSEETENGSDALRQKCSRDNLVSFDSWMNCNILCDAYSCCATNTCLKKADWCESYDICEMVKAYDPSEDAALSDFAEGDGEANAWTVHEITAMETAKACHKDMIHTQEGLGKCEEKCEDKMCCFEEGIANCAGNSNKKCSNFFTCKILNQRNSEVSSYVEIAPPNLAQVCDEKRVDANEMNAAECDEMCMPASCCKKGEEGLCDQDMCTAFKACRTVWFDEEEYELHQEGPSVEDAEAAAAIPQKPIAQLCSPEKMTTPAGEILCKNACEPATCCWEKDPARNCEETQKVMCLSATDCPHV